MNDNAILVDGKVVPVDDILEWGRWFETADRRVAMTVLNRRKRIRVSTVFLGIDHGDLYGGRRGELWFETIVFGTSIHAAQERYPDIESARRGHARMVGRARQARQLPAQGHDAKRFRKVMDRLLKKVRRRA